MISPQRFQDAWKACGVVGRDDVLERATRSVSLGISRQFVGDPGIGKTTIINEFAARLSNESASIAADPDNILIVPIATHTLAFHGDIDFYYALLCRVYNEHRAIDAPHAFVTMTTSIKQSGLTHRIPLARSSPLTPSTFYGDDLRWAAPEMFRSYLSLLVERYAIALIFDQIELARTEFFDNRPKYYSLLDSVVMALSETGSHKVSVITFDTQHWRHFARGLTVQDTADLKCLEGHVEYLKPLASEHVHQLLNSVTSILFPNGPRLTDLQLEVVFSVSGGYPRLVKDATELLCRWIASNVAWSKEILEESIVNGSPDAMTRIRISDQEREQIMRIALGESTSRVLPVLLDRGIVKKMADGSFGLFSTAFEQYIKRSHVLAEDYCVVPDSIQG
jgi:hypothetical protein